MRNSQQTTVQIVVNSHEEQSTDNCTMTAVNSDEEQSTNICTIVEVYLQKIQGADLTSKYAGT